MSELRMDLYYTKHKGRKQRKLYDRTKNKPCYIIWNKVKKYIGKDFKMYRDTNNWNFTIIDNYFVSLYWN